MRRPWFMRGESQDATASCAMTMYTKSAYVCNDAVRQHDTNHTPFCNRSGDRADPHLCLMSHIRACGLCYVIRLSHLNGSFNVLIS